MQRILKLVAKIAPTDSNVLLTGESGTGKELIARSLHLLSRRANGPFVPVNIGALPEPLMESELFGYQRGAFTGAVRDRGGLIEEADHGTLFLDEIGDMPLATQVKILRALENREIRRLGDNVPRLVDVRVVSATHRDLLAEARAGRFREDLYYRLNVVQIELPPLRERREDIGLLASYFLDRMARRTGRRLAFAPETSHLLERYDYPGNVRELQNAIEHAVAVSDSDVLAPTDLPAAIRAPRMLTPHGEAPEGSSLAEAVTVARAGAVSELLAARDQLSLADVEREHLQRVLAHHGGNATAAARQLGLSRTSMWRKLKLYGITRDVKRKP